MARGFRVKGHGQGLHYTAWLDPLERALLVGLMEQVHELLAADAAGGVAGPAVSEPDPQTDPPVGIDEEFAHIVAGIGAIGTGVSLAAEDAGDVEIPADARSFGDRDPALQRLLPTGNRTDEQAAAEFRRLAEPGLRARKAAALATAISTLRASGNAVDIDPSAALALLTALTDVRLVLGERLELRTDDDADVLAAEAAARSDDDPLVHAVVIFDFLTWLQTTLSEAMLRGLDRG